MRFHYISPSVLPSRTANSVHVVMQCDGLIRAGAEVTLYAKRAIRNESELLLKLQQAYGIDLSNARLFSYYSKLSHADNFRIAVLALRDLFRNPWPDIILSRNLYASYVIGVLQRRPLIFETHQLEQGFRKSMQRALMSCPWVTTVAISQKLVDCLTDHHGIAPARVLVLHDAALEE